METDAVTMVLNQLMKSRKHFHILDLFKIQNKTTLLHYSNTLFGQDSDRAGHVWTFSNQFVKMNEIVHCLFLVSVRYFKRLVYFLTNGFFGSSMNWKLPVLFVRLRKGPLIFKSFRLLTELCPALDSDWDLIKGRWKLPRLDYMLTAPFFILVYPSVYL